MYRDHHFHHFQFQPSSKPLVTGAVQGQQLVSWGIRLINILPPNKPTYVSLEAPNNKCGFRHFVPTNLKDTIGTGTAATVWDVLEALEGVEKGLSFHGCFSGPFGSWKMDFSSLGSWQYQSVPLSSSKYVYSCDFRFYIANVHVLCDSRKLPPAHPFSCCRNAPKFHFTSATSRPWHSDGESGCPFSWYLWSGRIQLKVFEALPCSQSTALGFQLLLKGGGKHTGGKWLSPERDWEFERWTKDVSTSKCWQIFTNLYIGT